MIDAIEREKPKVVKEINKGGYYHIECPSCGKTLNQTDAYCPGCGQKLELLSQMPKEAWP